MVDREKVIKGLKCCNPNEYHCGVCPYDDGYESCARCKPALHSDALALLKAQEPTKFQIKTAISNVDIPKDIDEEQFMAVLSQQYAALAKLYGDDVPTYSPS